jgi:PAS domain-containing protein
MAMNWTNSPSTKLVQNVMMASPNGVLVLQAIRGADGRLLDLYMTVINRVAEQELDCPAVEVLGQSFSLFFPHLAEKSLMERYRQVLDTGKSIQFDIQFFRSDDPRPIWWDITIVRMEKSLLITYTDITDTKSDSITELPMDMLQLAFDESASGISVFEALHDEQDRVNDFKLVMLNKAGLAMSGFLHNGLLGRTIWEMYPSTNINGLFGQYVKVYETGEPTSIEHYYPEYDTWRDVKIIRVDRGIMVTYNDITSLKKAEALHKQHEQLLGDVLKSISTAMAIVMPIRTEKGANHHIADFQVVKANAALATILGKSAPDMVGRSLVCSLPATNSSALLGHCMAAALEAQAQEFTMFLTGQSTSSQYKVSVAPSGDFLILSFADSPLIDHAN